MKKDKNDKTKLSNWVDGDCFALKIKCERYPEYNGRYLILIYQDIDKEGWKRRNDKYCYVKITKDKRIPESFEEIDKLELIKTEYYLHDTEIRRNPEKIKNLKPDEYNIYYSYLIDMRFKRGKIPEGFSYLGNHQIIVENEYELEERIIGMPFENVHDIFHTIDDYRLFNLKKGYYFTKEGYEDGVKAGIERDSLVNMALNMFSGPDAKENLKKIGIDVDKESKKDKETYVGK